MSSETSNRLTPRYLTGLALILAGTVLCLSAGMAAWPHASDAANAGLGAVLGPQPVLRLLAGLSALSAAAARLRQPRGKKLFQAITAFNFGVAVCWLLLNHQQAEGWLAEMMLLLAFMAGCLALASSPAKTQKLRSSRAEP